MSNDVVVQETKAVTVPVDNGKPALYNPAAFAQIWRAAQMFATSDLVPTAYKGKPENCFIAIEMADRMGISPFAMLQSLVIIQGKPSMEAKLIIALVNDSGIFEDPLDFEVVGDDPHAKTFKVRAFATMRKTSKLCQGPWITYQMVEGEGWLGKQGSKWKTMPDLMFRYRAASYFAKIYAPNITMGMQTREEMEDVTPINITPEKAPSPALVAPQKSAEDIPPLASVTIEGEQVDTSTGEVTDAVTTAAPARERGKASPGKKRRTDAEMEEDRLSDEADYKAAQEIKPVTESLTTERAGLIDDDNFPDPPGTVAAQVEPEAAETVADEKTADSGEVMGDLF